MNSFHTMVQLLPRVLEPTINFILPLPKSHIGNRSHPCSIMSLPSALANQRTCSEASTWRSPLSPPAPDPLTAFFHALGLIPTFMLPSYSAQQLLSLLWPMLTQYYHSHCKADVTLLTTGINSVSTPHGQQCLCKLTELPAAAHAGHHRTGRGFTLSETR